MVGRLQDRVAMITGGGGALGLCFAQAFVREGARVIVADVSPDAVDVACATLGDASRGIVVDIVCREQIAAAVELAGRAFDGIDILVNTAARFDMAALPEATEDQFDRLFNVNVKGLYFTIQNVATGMIRRGKGGKIINIASEAGRRGEKYSSLYSATKAAVINLTQSLGDELIGHGINVNAISPGVIDTPMLDRAADLLARIEGTTRAEARCGFSSHLPIGRLSRPEDLAGCAVFLASSESDYVVGQTYNVDGGRHMN